MSTNDLKSTIATLLSLKIISGITIKRKNRNNLTSEVWYSNNKVYKLQEEMYVQ